MSRDEVLFIGDDKNNEFSSPLSTNRVIADALRKMDEVNGNIKFPSDIISSPRKFAQDPRQLTQSYSILQIPWHLQDFKFKRMDLPSLQKFKKVFERST